MKTWMNFFIKILEILKSDPQTKIARIIFIGGLGLKGLGEFIYSQKSKDTEHTFTFVDSIDYTGYILIIIALFMFIHRYFTIQNNPVSLAYGIGMENMDIHPPLKAMPGYERYDCVEIHLPKIDSYDKDTVIKNYSFNQTLIKERVHNKNSTKVYVGALGSFPYLFLIGSLFRNAYSHINLLDYERHASKGGKWYKLPPFNEKEKTITHELLYDDMSIEEKIDALNKGEEDEVGIALSYTFAVNQDAIPEYLQNNTLYLKHSYGIGHDKLSNEEAQKKLLNELSSYIASLWNGHKKIHLFVSAQASVCINIGKSYMNNAHGTLVLHNYDNNSKTYNWGIEFDRGHIQ